MEPTNDILTSLSDALLALQHALASPNLGPGALKELSTIASTLSDISSVLRSNKQPMDPQTLLNIMCAAIKDFEGWAAPGETMNGTLYPQGSNAWQCRNPGNLRCGASKATWNHLAIGARNGFCVFRDEAAGMQGQKDVIISVATGRAPVTSPYQIAAKNHGLKDSSELTLLQYMLIRDPAADSNDPERFAKYLGDRMGVDYRAWQLKHLIA